MQTILRSFATACVFLLAAGRVPAVTFTFDDQLGGTTSTLTPDKAAALRTAFAEASQIWSGVLGDNMNVRLKIRDYSMASPSIIANTSVNKAAVPLADVVNALKTHATTAADAAATAHLPTGPSFDCLTSQYDTGALIYKTGTVCNSSLSVPVSEAHALGLTVAGTLDGTINFNDDMYGTMDFGHSTGHIQGGKYDAVGALAHEIGHALGFYSGVDTVDYMCAPNPATALGYPRTFAPWDIYATFCPLDLFRYSATSVSTNPSGLNHGIPMQDLGQGEAGYFSLDGGLTNLARFASGAYDGDGYSASHWKVGSRAGFMEAVVNPGTMFSLTSTDLTAFDVLGYTPVPEPMSVCLLLAAVVSSCVARSARRDRGQGTVTGNL